MNRLIQTREQNGYSQRALAKKARVSFRTYQLLEWQKHNPRLSTLEKISKAFHNPAAALSDVVFEFLAEPKDSLAQASRHMAKTPKNWMMPFFEFVDAFRKNRNLNLITTPPTKRLNLNLAALCAATVETLCDEAHLPTPEWVFTTPNLAAPFFVAGVENLKATALVESPLAFRKRGIFVLKNFLERM